MIVATDVTITTMIEHKKIYLDLIDHMDQFGVGDEVSVRLYEHKLRGLLDAVAPLQRGRGGVEKVDAVRRKLEATLDIANLQRAGLVLQIDRSRGVMAFAPFLIEMFRHFDLARLRHLNSADFEAIRRSFNELQKVFLSMPSYSANDDEFVEQIGVLRREVRFAQTKMKESVESLHRQSRRLADIVDTMRAEVIGESQQAQEALREINHIYIRSIIPSLEFLNQHTDLKNGVAALTALTEIGDHLFNMGNKVLGSQIHYAVETIRSYRHDIEIIRSSLMRYVQQSRTQRYSYDCIERAWNSIHSASKVLQDGSLKGNKLQLDHEVFQVNRTFHGLKTRQYEAKIEWSTQNHRILLQEHLRTTLPRVKEAKVSIHRIEGLPDEKGKDLLRLDMRMAAIGALTEQWLAEDTDDVHVAMFRLLHTQLQDFDLSDVLTSLTFLLHREGFSISPVFQMGMIETEAQSMRYYKHELKVAHA